MSKISKRDYLDTLDDECSEDDFTYFDRLLHSDRIDYSSLFFLYEMYSPYGEKTYDGVCFSD